jgi:hypothetical protein
LGNGSVNVPFPADHTSSANHVPVGRFVTRFYPNDSFGALAESAPFTLTNMRIDAGQSSYAVGDAVEVTYRDMLVSPPPSTNDWVSIARLGSDASTSFTKWVYTGTTANQGTVHFDTTGLQPGYYVARFYPQNGWTVEGESEPFTIGMRGTPPAR